MNLLTVPGARLAYEVIDMTPPWVANPPTVLFHHGVGTDLNIWAFWLPYLAERFRIVRFSMRGFGDSTSEPPSTPWRLDTFCDDLLHVANSTQTQRFHVIAESFGGMVALATIAPNPERFLSATLLSTPHCGTSIKPLAQWPEFAKSPAGMEQWCAGMMEARFGQNHPGSDAMSWFQREQEKTSASQLIAFSNLIQGVDLSDKLNRIKTPVLLIAGDASPYVGVGQVSTLHKLLPNSRVNVLPGVRHGIAFSHAHECAAAFLAGIAN